jgi:shikimate dehydrogenase
VHRHAALATLTRTALQACTLADVADAYDVVINATSSSLNAAAVPVVASALQPAALVYDMMYGPAAQGFLDWAQAQGARARDGLGMLVEQAAEAFFIWRGVRPPSAQVLQELRAI